ncbi:MAG: hypothetical protein C4319_02080 [Acidimicrobiia bacterium]
MALAKAWQIVIQDDKIRVAVLTGSGDAFCAGMDQKKTIPAGRRVARGERISDEEFAGLKAAPKATLQVDRPLKPIVAAVNGHCRGQRTDMLLATDYRIAGDSASFALEEVVNEVVEANSVHSRALEVAERLAGFDPRVVTAILKALWSNAFPTDLEDSVRRSHKIGDEIMRE